MARYRNDRARGLGPPAGSGPWRVLHVAQSSEGGVATVVADLAAGQRAAGLDVTVACRPGSRLFEAAREAGVTVVGWDADRQPGPGLPREVTDVRRVVRSVRPDVVHLHSSKAGLAGRLVVRGRIATVFQPHAWSFDAVGGVEGRAAAAWERWGAPWAHQLLCVSEAERAQGEAARIRGRYAVVPNGVDLRRFSPTSPAERAAARARLGVGEAVPLVVCVGRLCRQKGQDVLLDAWTQVRGSVNGAELALVGDGPDRDALAARADGAAVRFAGDVADPRDWYRAADLMVLPSRWEGMALTPLEAMACACPVVVTDVAGARESLPPAQARTGLVPPEDPHRLAEAVSARLADPSACRALGAEAREHVVRRHDIGGVVDAVQGVYETARRVWAG